MRSPASNGWGSYRVTAEADLAAYDKLPASARRALREATVDWAAPPILRLWKRGDLKTGGDVARYVADIDIRQVGKDAYKYYGADHPQAARPKRKVRA